MVILDPVAAVHAHFRGQVVQSSAHGLASVAWCMARPSKVCQFDGVEGPQDILWLDVSMYHTLPVQIRQSLRDLVDYIGCVSFREPFALPAVHFIVDAPVRCVLHYQVDVLLVVEKTIHRQNVPMQSVATDLDFSLDLLLHTVFDQLFFEENFQSHNQF